MQLFLIDWMERAHASLNRLARQRNRNPQPEHLIIGQQGEDAAFWHLTRKGYKVVARRWTAGNLRGDLDLIAWQGELLCIFEVKTRTARDLTPANAAVDRNKRMNVRRMARAYLRHLPYDNWQPTVRFDVISVYLLPGKEPEIEHFESSFSWHERYSREDPF